MLTKIQSSLNMSFLLASFIFLGLTLNLIEHQVYGETASPAEKTSSLEEDNPETCESLQDQFDFYRRLAMQDREKLKKDLKKKSNRKSYQQKAIKMQLREMDEAQQKAREIHKKLEKNCQ